MKVKRNKFHRFTFVSIVWFSFAMGSMLLVGCKDYPTKLTYGLEIVTDSQSAKIDEQLAFISPWLTPQSDTVVYPDEFAFSIIGIKERKEYTWDSLYLLPDRTKENAVEEGWDCDYDELFNTYSKYKDSISSSLERFIRHQYRDTTTTSNFLPNLGSSETAYLLIEDRMGLDTVVMYGRKAKVILDVELLKEEMLHQILESAKTKTSTNPKFVIFWKPASNNVLPSDVKIPPSNGKPKRKGSSSPKPSPVPTPTVSQPEKTDLDPSDLIPKPIEITIVFDPITLTVSWENSKKKCSEYELQIIDYHRKKEIIETQVTKSSYNISPDLVQPTRLYLLRLKSKCGSKSEAEATFSIVNKEGSLHFSKTCQLK